MIGGDDIDVRHLGVPLHPEARVMDPQRQAAEFALLGGHAEFSGGHGASFFEKRDPC